MGSRHPNPVLPDEVLVRISHLVGIWKALETSVPDHAQAVAWVKKPNGNPLLNGRPPLSHMLEKGLGSIEAIHGLLNARMNVW